MRFAIFAAFAALVFIGAMALGEEPLFALTPFAFIVPLLLAPIALLILRPHRWPVRIAGGIAIFATFALGVMAGDAARRRAFNECVGTAWRVQLGIDDFHRRTGRYPATLAEAGEVPCTRFPRGTILRYELTESGYNLGFRDFLIHWRGSEREPITAHK
jgi:hypothetical protein